MTRHDAMLWRLVKEMTIQRRAPAERSGSPLCRSLWHIPAEVMSSRGPGGPALSVAPRQAPGHQGRCVAASVLMGFPNGAFTCKRSFSTVPCCGVE